MAVLSPYLRWNYIYRVDFVDIMNLNALSIYYLTPEVSYMFTLSDASVDYYTNTAHCRCFRFLFLLR